MMSIARLGWRLVGRRDLLQAIIVVAVPMAVLLALFMTIHSFTLSAAQQSDQSFGRFNGSVELGGDAKTLDGLPPAGIIKKARSYSRDKQSAVVLRSFDLKFGALARWEVANYLEADWQRDPFGREFTVTSGRLPNRPGEVAVAEGLFKHPIGRVLTAASGNIRLTVVGVVRDEFARSSADVLAAAGTWALFDWERLHKAGFGIGADVEVLGDFRNWKGLAQLSARFQLAQGSGGSAVETVDDRQAVAHDPPETFIESEPLVYRAPASALAVLCALLLLGLRGRRARRWAGIFRAIGVRPARSSIAVMGGTILLGLAALPFGLLGGEVLGLLARLVASRVDNQPLSPPVSALPEAVRFAGLAAIALIGASVATGSLQQERTVYQLLARRPPPRMMRAGRYFAALCATVGIVFLVPSAAPGENATSTTILAAAAVSLLLPDAFRALRRASIGRGARYRLVTNRLLIDQGKSWAVCAALIACIGPFVALSEEHSADVSSQRATWDYQFPPNQVAVGRAPNARLDRIVSDGVSVIERVTRHRPLYVSQIIAGRDTLADPAVGLVAPAGRAPRLQPSLLGVPNVQALHKLLGRGLTTHAAAVVANGGVLHFTSYGSVPSSSPLGLSHGDQGAKLRRVTPPVPIVSVPSDHAWALQTSGFVLNQTARRLDLPMHEHLAVFTDISARQNRAIDSAIAQAGIPIQALTQPRPFELAAAPIALTYGRYGILALVAILMAIALGSSARSLRKESANLIAIGVRPTWARRTLATQSAILVLIGLIGGGAVGATSVAIYTIRLGGAVAIPSEALLILVLGSLCVVSLVSWLAARGLTAQRGAA